MRHRFTARLQPQIRHPKAMFSKPRGGPDQASDRSMTTAVTRKAKDLRPIVERLIRSATRRSRQPPPAIAALQMRASPTNC